MPLVSVCRYRYRYLGRGLGLESTDPCTYQIHASLFYSDSTHKPSTPPHPSTPHPTTPHPTPRTGLQCIIIPAPRHANAPNYCRTISSLPQSSVDIWLKIPMGYSNKEITLDPKEIDSHIPANELKKRKVDDKIIASSVNSSGSDDSQCKVDIDSWAVWDNFRHTTGSDRRVHIALEFSDISDLNICTHEFLPKWVSEPLRAIIVSTKLFLMNKKKKLFLPSKFHEILLYFSAKFQLHVILQGRTDSRSECTTSSYFDCIQSILDKENDRRQNEQGKNDLYESFCRPFRDSLRTPLQPLMENLDSKTYSVMEEDPVKYDTYTLAIARALEHRWAAIQSKDGAEGHSAGAGVGAGAGADEESQGKMTGNSRNGKKIVHTSREVAAVGRVQGLHGGDIGLEGQSSAVVVMVVGAGRGPLVKATITASETTGVPVRIYAVEKNLHAVITLRNRAVAENWDNVRVIAKDMRHWNPTELSDIMVSELLGSWGDNELSPECLDIAQERCLKKNGVSIPTSYTSFIAPMTSSKLWGAAREMPVMSVDSFGGPSYSRARTGLDSPYVVHFHNCRVISRAEELFKFSHPSPLPSEAIDNSRYRSVSFTATESTTIHGFAGTFESVLYDDISFSTVPHTFSEGMFSWFPLFVPLLSPIKVIKGQIITVAVWRCVSPQKVWYEWGLTSPLITPVQNPCGHSSWVGL